MSRKISATSNKFICFNVCTISQHVLELFQMKSFPAINHHYPPKVRFRPEPLDENRDHRVRSGSPPPFHKKNSEFRPKTDSESVTFHFPFPT